MKFLEKHGSIDDHGIERGETLLYDLIKGRENDEWEIDQIIRPHDNNLVCKHHRTI